MCRLTERGVTLLVFFGGAYWLLYKAVVSFERLGDVTLFFHKATLDKNLRLDDLLAMFLIYTSSRGED